MKNESLSDFMLKKADSIDLTEAYSITRQAIEITKSTHLAMGRNMPGKVITGSTANIKIINDVRKKN